MKEGLESKIRQFGMSLSYPGLNLEDIAYRKIFII